MSSVVKGGLAALSVVICSVGVVLFLSAMRSPYTPRSPNQRRIQWANVVILAGVVELLLLLTFAPL